MRIICVTALLRVRAGYSQPNHVLSLGFTQSQPGSWSPRVKKKTLPELFPRQNKYPKVVGNFRGAISLEKERDSLLLCESLACDPGD